MCGKFLENSASKPQGTLYSLESMATREEILAPTAPRICSACPTCLEECDPQEGPGHPLQSQAERNLLCRERATYLHSKQVAADGKSVRYGSVINCCNCRLYLAQGAGAGGPGPPISYYYVEKIRLLQNSWQTFLKSGGGREPVYHQNKARD